MYVCYNNNTHAMLELDASLESPMQGLHSESLWRACCLGQHCVLIHTIVRKSLLKYCKTRTKRAPRRERVKVDIYGYCTASTENWERTSRYIVGISYARASFWVTLNVSLVWCITDFWVYVYVFLRKELVPHIVWNPTITPQNDVCPLQQ